MSRLIDADALMKCIPREEYCSRFAVANAPTVEPQRWIPCSERLPEKCGVYLVSGSNWVWLCELVQIMTVYGWANDARNPVVTAWMPLPEPYEERKDDEQIR